MALNRATALLLALFWALAAAEAAAEGARKSGYGGDTVVLQGGGGEFFIGGVPPGWQAGGADDNAVGHHRQWVPKGQPLDEWRDIIAYQVFPRFANIPARTFLSELAKHYVERCDQVLVTELEDTENANGFDDATQILACTRNKDNDLGEVTYFRAVSGAAAQYVIQRGWRMLPFAPEKLPVTGEQLNGARDAVVFGHACKLADRERPCPAGWEPVLSGLDRSKRAVIFPAAQ